MKHDLIRPIADLEYVHLSYYSRDYQAISVHPEALEKIRAIIAAHRACEHCYGYITAENPEVYRNCCLNCAKETPGYEYIGLYTGKNGEVCHAFLDKNGHLHLASSSEDRIGEYYDLEETLLYHGFQMPTATHNRNGQELRPNRWNLYGDPRRPVVILSTQDYDKTILGYYILRRGTPAEELNRRKKVHRELWNAVKACFTRFAHDFEIVQALVERLAYREELKSL